jgi:hypothetical protein
MEFHEINPVKHSPFHLQFILKKIKNFHFQTPNSYRTVRRETLDQMDRARARAREREREKTNPRRSIGVGISGAILYGSCRSSNPLLLCASRFLHLSLSLSLSPLCFSGSVCLRVCAAKSRGVTVRTYKCFPLGGLILNLVEKARA